MPSLSVPERGARSTLTFGACGRSPAVRSGERLLRAGGGPQVATQRKSCGRTPVDQLADVVCLHLAADKASRPPQDQRVLARRPRLPALPPRSGHGAGS
jgi:hypothetical protein